MEKIIEALKAGNLPEAAYWFSFYHDKPEACRQLCSVADCGLDWLRIWLIIPATDTQRLEIYREERAKWSERQEKEKKVSKPWYIFW